MNLLRKSLRKGRINQDLTIINSYESKPPIAIRDPSAANANTNADAEAVKRRISRDVTLDTASDSIDDAQTGIGGAWESSWESGGSSGSGGDPAVRRSSSGSNSRGSSESRRTKSESASEPSTSSPPLRRYSIQDDILNERRDLEGGIDTSVSSLTLGSGLRLSHRQRGASVSACASSVIHTANNPPPLPPPPYGRAKSKSFDVQESPAAARAEAKSDSFAEADPPVGPSAAGRRKPRRVPAPSAGTTRRPRSLGADRRAPSDGRGTCRGGAPGAIPASSIPGSSIPGSATIPASSASDGLDADDGGMRFRRPLLEDPSVTLTELERSDRSSSDSCSAAAETAADSPSPPSRSRRSVVRSLLDSGIARSPITDTSGSLAFGASSSCSDSVFTDHGSVQTGYERRRRLSLDRNAGSAAGSKSLGPDPSPRRHTVDRSGGAGSVPTDASAVRGSFVRNQAKVLPALRRLLSESSAASSGSEGSYLTSRSQTLELLSGLHETNLLNESTILKLQGQLNELEKERDAFRTNSQRVMQVMSGQNAELTSQLKKERKGFANMSFVHKKELKEWMDKASVLSTKILQLEKQAAAREEDDERRSEKIVGLERDMARLAEMYSKTDGERGSGGGDGDGTTGEPERSAPSSRSPVPEGIASERIAALEAQLAEQISRNRFLDLEVQCWKHKHDRLEERCRERSTEADGGKRCEELESEVKHYKVVVERLEDELSSVRRNCSENGSVSTSGNEELLTKICQMVDENTLLIDKCHELEDALEQCRSNSQQELETSKRALESSIRDLVKDLKVAKRENSRARTTIEELRSENAKLLASSAEKGKKKEKVKNMLRSSITSEESVGTDLAHDNDAPLSEEEHKEALAMIEEMENENEVLRASMKQAMSLASDMNKRMISFVASHESTVENYQEQLESARSQLKMEKVSNEALSKELNGLKRENEKLKASLAEANSLVETAEECVGDLTTKNNSLEGEIEAASSKCEALKREIDSLKRDQSSLSTSKPEDATSTDQGSLKDLRTANEKLTQELQEKNEAMQLFKSALDSLKSEQITIKETVVALRQENARLRDGEDDSTAPSTPNPSRPTLRPASHPSPTCPQELSDFDARLKKIERENNGLRKANADLSAKLFDEMEKTDALQTANEGLAARICKLVTFIKQNPAPQPAKNSSLS